MGTSEIRSLKPHREVISHQGWPFRLPVTTSQRDQLLEGISAQVVGTEPWKAKKAATTNSDCLFWLVIA